MKVLNRRFLLIALSLFLMTSCSEQKPAPNVKTDTKTQTNTTNTQTNTEPVETAAESKAPTASVSKKLDACEVLPKADVEKVIGEMVKSANLSRVTEGTEATAAFSQCTYTTDSGNSVEFFARRSPINDNTPEAIQKAKDTMKDFAKKGLEDLTGLGKTAYWVGSPINQLHVFAGENIYVYFTMRGIKTEPEAKAKAIQLAHRAISLLAR
jgi:hypothetical protein